MKSGADVLNEVLTELDVKAPTLAKKIGLKYQRLQDIQSGRVQKISAQVANAINAKYPQYPLSYLLTGEKDAIVGNEVKGNNNVIGSHNGTEQTQLINKLVDELAASRRNNEKLLNIIEEQRKEINELRSRL